MPHQKALDMPGLCYLPFDKTPSVTSSGSQRDVDDYQPKAQIEKKFEDETLALDDAKSIEMFSKTFAMEESLTRKYLEHLEYIRLKKKRSEGRKQKNKRKSGEPMKTLIGCRCSTSEH